ncbi:MAG: flagellar motor switch protein FliM [Candidatus Zixiibacteriota bacterium]
MAQVLSQEEIDALLSSAAGGSGQEAAAPAPEARAAVTYDFKHPNRVSKDQIRTLENVHGNFAGHLGSALSGMLRAVVDCELVSVDQITYSEFIMSLAWPSCTYKFSMAPLEGLCLIDFSPALGFAFVDRMFGGPGKGLGIERELTGIERRVLDSIATRGLRELATAWKRIVETNLVIAGFETTPQFIQIVPPGETVIVTTFQVKLLQVHGIVTLCYPYITLEGIVEKLSGQHWVDASKSRGTDQERAVIAGGLRGVEGQVTAVLALTDITMREFLNVRVGDVIVTDTRAGEFARIFVGGVEKYIGMPGTRGRHRAVRVVGAMEEDKT